MTFNRTHTRLVLVGSAPSSDEDAPGARWYGWTKIVVEWVAALAMLFMSVPIIAALAILLKTTSKGPVFYSQMRLGRNGREFRIYKLRTMTHKCESTTGPVWSIGDDPRVTRVGRWLRDTHLDELPQIWNVLRGEMSLIGPRPERPEIAAEIERVLPEFRGRLRVRPGITGLAQMRLPADTDLHSVPPKLAHDLRYVRELGPMLDFRIAISTVFHFVGLGATAVSRQLVRSFAPSPSAVPQIRSGAGLSATGRRIDGPHGGEEQVQRSRVA